MGLLRVLGCWKPSPTALLHALSGCTPIENLIAQRQGEYACRRRWGSILPLHDLPNHPVPTPELALKRLWVRLQLELPGDCEFLDKADWPPHWEHTRSPPRTVWDINPCSSGPPRQERADFLDALDTPTRWMMYCDGSYVWRPNAVQESKGGAGAIIMHQTHVIEYARLGLGSLTHSRDAELWALLRGIQLLNTLHPPPDIREVVIVLDAALALKQLHRIRPEPGHNITVQWHSAALQFTQRHPHITL